MIESTKSPLTIRRQRCRWLVLGVVMLTFASFVGCQTEPITGRTFFAGAVSEPQANEMGDTAYKQLLEQAPLSQNAAEVAMLERIGNRIAAVVNERMKKEGRETYKWEFKLIDAPDTVNAFALPGGKVAFYTGILPICDGEKGVAVVMGHEIGHAYGEHGRKRVSEDAVAKFGLAAVLAAMQGADVSSATYETTAAALGLGYEYGVKLPFSRGDESAADYIGLILMAEAGYDPREATEFWKRMGAASGGQAPPEFASTHPSHDTRVAELEGHMPEAMEIYEKTKSGGGQE